MTEKEALFARNNLISIDTLVGENNGVAFTTYIYIVSDLLLLSI